MTNPIQSPLPAIVVCLAICAGCGRADPISPSANLPYSKPNFDARLANADAEWEFLFADNHRVVKTDIYGAADTFLFDIRALAGDLQAEFCGEGSVSPDGRYLVTAFYRERTPENDILEEIIVFDFETSTSRMLSGQFGEFGLDWTQPVRWFTNESFTAWIQHCTRRQDGYSDRSEKGLIVNVARPEVPFVVDFEVADPAILRVFREPATVPRPAGVPVVRVDPVIDAIEGWGDYWERNNDREQILLDERIVRCSDGRVEVAPSWDEDLQLFIWYECGYPYRVFYMDAKGRYREWHIDSYWGKIPKRSEPTEAKAVEGKRAGR